MNNRVELLAVQSTGSALTCRFCGTPHAASNALMYTVGHFHGQPFHDYACDACVEHVKGAGRFPHRERTHTPQPTPQEEPMTQQQAKKQLAQAVAQQSAKASVQTDEFRTTLVEYFKGGAFTKDELREKLYKEYPKKAKGYIALRLGKCLARELPDMGIAVKCDKAGKYSVPDAGTLLKKPTAADSKVVKDAAAVLPKEELKKVKREARKEHPTQPVPAPLADAIKAAVGTANPAPKPSAKVKKGARKNGKK